MAQLIFLFTPLYRLNQKIEQFRIEKAKHIGNYRRFRRKYLESVVLELFKTDIEKGRTKLRESKDTSLRNYIATKIRTMRDYTDACFRYLRVTGMVSISHRGRSISIVKEKKNDLEYILDTVDRRPIFINDINKYKDYLFNPLLPELYTDNKENLIGQILDLDKSLNKSDLMLKNIIELKDLSFELLEERKNTIVKEKVKEIKEHKVYEDIKNTFADIKKNDLYDIPLMFEWNTWRAMTMLDGGEIVPNIKFDDEGNPMSTAMGNMADIVCDYGDFILTVEVTMQQGAKQYENEGEPVARHLAKHKKDTGKDGYCLFIAPTINEACISYFYMLHLTNIKFYGGKSVIVPMELSTFEKMLEDSYKADYIPSPSHVKSFFEYSKETALNADNEQDWYAKVQDRALNWLSA